MVVVQLLKCLVSSIPQLASKFHERWQQLSYLATQENTEMQSLHLVQINCWKGQEKQKKWKEKLEEMSKDRLVKKVYMEEARGRRPWGQPRKR